MDSTGKEKKADAGKTVAYGNFVFLNSHISGRTRSMMQLFPKYINLTTVQ